jgi:hypothetical protein
MSSASKSPHSSCYNKSPGKRAKEAAKLSFSSYFDCSGKKYIFIAQLSAFIMIAILQSTMNKLQ